MRTHISQRLPDLVGAGLVTALGIFAYVQGAGYAMCPIRELGLLST